MIPTIPVACHAKCSICWRVARKTTSAVLVASCPLVEVYRVTDAFPSWNVGTCVPPRLLSVGGYLQMKKKRLESLRLVSVGDCILNDDYAISSFENLKSFSWTGLLEPRILKDLCKALSRSSDRLEHLELDLTDWYELNLWNSDKDNFLAFDILDLPCNEAPPIYHNIRSLSLSDVSFKGAAKKIAQGFDFASLRSLKIRNCPGWTDFLNHVAQLEQPLKLKYFEIQSSLLLSGEQVEAPEYAVKNFLSAFQGLEELYIALTDTKVTLLCWQALFSHRSTLKSFVHHPRHTDIEDQAPPFEVHSARDFRSDHLADDYAASIMRSSRQNPLKALDLECIGLCSYSGKSCKVLVRESIQPHEGYGLLLTHVFNPIAEKPTSAFHREELTETCALPAI